MHTAAEFMALLAVLFGMLWIISITKPQPPEEE